MKPDYVEALLKIATEPLLYGSGAGFARWLLGDRNGGLKLLLSYVLLSVFVAFVLGQFLADERMADGKRIAYICLTALGARDFLMGFLAIAAQFKDDPLTILRRVREAVVGAPPSGPSSGDPK